MQMRTCEIGRLLAVWVVVASTQALTAAEPGSSCPQEKARLFSTALTWARDPAQKPADQGMRPLRIKQGEQIVAIGDSITQAGGYLRAIDAVFEQQYADLKLPRIINVGISGQKAEDLVKRFDQDVVQRRPAIVTISIGINDVWHRVDKPHDDAVLKAYAENVEQMVKQARAAGIRVLLLAPTLIDENPQSEGNLRLAKYIAAGKEIAERNRCHYVELHAMFLRAVKRHAATRPAATTRPADDLTVDGVHMKPIGDALIAVGVLQALGVPDEKIAATDLSTVFH